MDPRNIIDIGRNVILLIGQVAIFFLCIGFIGYIYEENILPDKTVAETYHVTSCTVLNKMLTTKDSVVPRYRADFLLAYAIDGRQYKSTVSGNGLDYAFTTDQASQEEILAEFDINAAYPCWYNPEHPQMLVLVLRHSWSSTFPLAVPSVIALIMLYYIFKMIFQCIEAIVFRMRHKF